MPRGIVGNISSDPVGRCPSCAGELQAGRCTRCGAYFDGTRWRVGEVPMEKSKASDYVLCPECSTAAGKEVHYHRHTLTQETEDRLPWEETAPTVKLTCPKGHEVKG